MHFTIIGGDKRSLYLAELLLSDGHGVSCLALDKAALPDGAVHTDSIARGTVILPLPAERGGMLNAPFASKEFSAADIADAIPGGSKVLGGKLSPALSASLGRRGIAVTDIMQCPDFTAYNAAICAEGAVSLLSTVSDKALLDSCYLIVGFGRIGKLVTKKLHDLGCEVSVMSRSSESRAMAEAFGVKAVTPDAGSVLSLFDAVVNTAPAPVLLHPELLRRDCILIELASSPGFEPKDFENYYAAPGLPGKYAPRSAAKLIYNAIKGDLT